uniref:OSJNBb0013J13.6 protein n=3 Tax=Oryza TaxID=4527 RepID=Q7XP14_ORYSJ|nr:OSJNBb0013J13.6 [Oryza sativa Japonica Group]
MKLVVCAMLMLVIISSCTAATSKEKKGAEMNQLKDAVDQALAKAGQHAIYVGLCHLYTSVRKLQYLDCKHWSDNRFT